MPIGTPTAEMRDRFTRVLKGHIALATAIFPHGHARRPARCASRGGRSGRRGSIMRMAPATASAAYLAVHEGPQRIAKPSYPGGGPTEPLRAGMILSNEPGYYKAGEYGIRIENLVLVEERDDRRAATSRCWGSRR